ncbi:T9SS type A sorting domain-containing protein [Flavobacterium sp.]|uniref:T9SS type A sorting domain-containing protein n=1 Tax=Flavobacterium sp. TaxID=239 RepID=UPI00286A981B|nr:T9SS type A sorting domain-containing protein [Flavobacterium sp.]
MKYKLLSALLFPFVLLAQGYTSYFTGNSTNITTNTENGICLMGGATEHDNAMRWLLQKANGGDIVVLRCTGSNGYNDYLYTDLGIAVNSVETLVITSVAGATNPYVLDKVAKAEMIWFAGGDQYNYVSYFKNNALEDLINQHVNVKHAPIGGTSAGMAILCGKYFSAQNGSVTSAEALSNPYNQYVTLGIDDFLDIPFMQNVTTDTHFDNPDRKGRLVTFLGKMATDYGMRSFGIASNEYVAVCIDSNGKAAVYGDYPNYQEFAYFLQSNCQNTFAPEVCQTNSPLTWNRGGEAVKVYKVPGTMNGTNYFQLSDWQTGFGGTWEHWTANNGALSQTSGTPSTCTLALEDFSKAAVQVYPVPFSDQITISGFENAMIKVYDINAKLIYQKVSSNATVIDTQNYDSGIYTIVIEKNQKAMTRKVIKN